jgi:hypothetical protein
LEWLLEEEMTLVLRSLETTNIVLTLESMKQTAIIISNPPPIFIESIIKSIEFINRKQ